MRIWLAVIAGMSAPGMMTTTPMTPFWAALVMHDMVAVRAPDGRQRRGEGGGAVAGGVDDPVLERRLAGRVVAEAAGDLVVEEPGLARPGGRRPAPRPGR